MTTLTFLFTDIEGSTTLLRRLGDDAFSELLVRHHRLIRDGLKRFDGSEHGTSGDSFFAAFTSTDACVAAAVTLQKTFATFDWPTGEHVAVRMGVHLGEASHSEAGLVGYDINRALRIAEAAHGGQVLLSCRAADAVAASLPLGVSLRRLGTYSLKNLERAESLFQLEVKGLPSDFPPLRAVSHAEYDADIRRTRRTSHGRSAFERSIKEMSAALDGTISALGQFTELREPNSAGHQIHVGNLASSLGASIAARYGLDDEMIDHIRQAGELHDIGKVAVPAEILTRRGPLEFNELDLVRQHTVAGYEILSKASLPWPIPDVALQHHERLDGSGYPLGRAHEEIILPARIVAVADVLESMTNHRAYRRGLAPDQALDLVRAQSGILFDPDVVDACVTIFEEGYSFDAVATSS